MYRIYIVKLPWFAFKKKAESANPTLDRRSNAILTGRQCRLCKAQSRIIFITHQFWFLGWMIYFLLTSSVRSLQRNLRQRPWCIALAIIARSIHLVNRHMVFLLWIWACDQFITNNWSVNNFKKHVTSMSCTLELAIQSGDTGLRISFLTAVN